MTRGPTERPPLKGDRLWAVRPSLQEGPSVKKEEENQTTTTGQTSFEGGSDKSGTVPSINKNTKDLYRSSNLQKRISTL